MSALMQWSSLLCFWVVTCPLLFPEVGQSQVALVSGGGSFFGLGRGGALLLNWCHLGSVCCGVMRALCPGLMHVQRPCRRIASCS